MITKSPSGALSPYYYKGGYFHGIHYGSYFDRSDALFSIMKKEEEFILKSQAKRRILIDLFETNLTGSVLERISKHLSQISPRIVKIAIASDKKSLRKLHKAVMNGTMLGKGQVEFFTDMEEAKTWLVHD